MGRRNQPAADGPLYEFAQGLRELRRKAGFIPYRLLARRTGLSASVLAAAASGEHLPSLETVRAYVRANGGDVALWEARWRELSAAMAVHTGTPSTVVEPELDPVTPLDSLDPTTAGPFTLVGRLGTGETGQVYLGSTSTGRTAAIKVIRPDLVADPLVRRRLTSDLTAIRHVRSQLIAAVIDADLDAEIPWLATEYVPGPTLANRVERFGPLSDDQTIALATEVAQALRVLHEAGLVHRDLNPSNVILSESGTKLVDIGIADSAVIGHTRPTATGFASTSIAFMAPEVAAGESISAAADVFAFGCLLAYAATGTPPFGVGTPAAMVYRIAHAEPDLSRLTDAGDSLRGLVAACLAKGPVERPTIAQILDSLTRLADVRPTVAQILDSRAPLADVPITIYLSDEAVHSDVETAVEALLTGTGLAISTREEPVFGSYFRRMWASMMRSPLGHEVACGLGHTVDVRLVTSQDAIVTSTMMQCVPPVLAALQPTKDAVIRVGALLIVKRDWSVAVHQLTAAQQLQLDHMPHLATSPHEIIEALALQPGTPNGDASKPAEWAHDTRLTASESDG